MRYCALTELVMFHSLYGYRRHRRARAVIVHPSFTELGMRTSVVICFTRCTVTGGTAGPEQ